MWLPEAYKPDGNPGAPKTSQFRVREFADCQRHRGPMGRGAGNEGSGTSRDGRQYDTDGIRRHGIPGGRQPEWKVRAEKRFSRLDRSRILRGISKSADLEDGNGRFSPASIPPTSAIDPAMDPREQAPPGFRPQFLLKSGTTRGSNLTGMRVAI